MLAVSLPAFEEPRIDSHLDDLAPDELDRLPFGVIGFDAKTHVRVYNAFESRAAGLRRESVVGKPLFDVVAPCMNNFLVAQRFEDAAESGSALDAIVDYVLTLRMRPVKVRLRLVSSPDATHRYVLVERNA